MEVRKVAIACQGGGMHGAFTCGVLDAILKVKEEEFSGALPVADTQRRFEIVGLSGTSAGALNAFMVWYGLMTDGSLSGRFAEARRAVNHLWDVFQVCKSGEVGMNWLTQSFYRLAELGVTLKQPNTVQFNDQILSLLRQWSAVENAIAPSSDFGEIRPEYYDFLALLRTCAPKFVEIQARLDAIANDKVRPRLLLGAVEVLSGRFEAFDSWSNPKVSPEQRRTISYEAVAASGTLPDLRRSQRIAGLKNSDGQDPLYWDGVFSQNPPVSQFAARTARDDTPDEIWVVRINPQKRDREPTTLASIEDRRNELAGNLSLYQELHAIQTVNKLSTCLDDLAAIAGEGHENEARLRELRTRFASYKPIDIYMITMHQDQAGLGVASKFDRSPDFVTAMRRHGEMRAAQFLPLWLTKSPRLVAWPDGDALQRIDGGSLGS